MNSTQRFNVHHPGLMRLPMNLKNRPAPTSIVLSLFILMVVVPRVHFGINPMAFVQRGLKIALVDGGLREDTPHEEHSDDLGRKEAA
jgi:hypothetical protein